MSFAHKSSLLDTPAGLTPVESLWFEDGNLILRAEDSLFRIYSGILSARSSVFKDMFAFPPPAEGNDNMDGCPIVEVYDSAEDMTYFLQAILDSRYSTFVHDNPPCLTLPPVILSHRHQPHTSPLSPESSDSARNTTSNISAFEQCNISSQLTPQPLLTGRSEIPNAPSRQSTTPLLPSSFSPENSTSPGFYHL